MNSILMYVFSKTKVGKFLDGKKTIIGAVVIILVAAMETLEKLAPMFPNIAWLGQAAGQIKVLLASSEGVLEAVGVSFLALGVLHKQAKKQVADK